VRGAAWRRGAQKTRLPFWNEIGVISGEHSNPNQVGGPLRRWVIGVEYVVELRGRARGRGDSRGRFWQRRRTVGSMPHRGKGQTQSPCAGWKPLQGSAATMSQAGLQARAGSPDPLRGTRQVSVEFVHRRAPPRAVPRLRGVLASPKVVSRARRWSPVRAPLSLRLAAHKPTAQWPPAPPSTALEAPALGQLCLRSASAVTRWFKIPKGPKKRARTRTAQTQMVQPPTTASPRSPGGSARRQATTTAL
jgi:hypothetical protein